MEVLYKVTCSLIYLNEHLCKFHDINSTVCRVGLLWHINYVTQEDGTIDDVTFHLSDIQHYPLAYPQV